MSTKQITRMALMTAIALTIFMVEAQIPLPVPIPGMKLGFANIVTVYAMFVLGPKNTLAILLSRIFLGSIFSGRVTTFFYSLVGGLLCYLVMLGMRKIVTSRQIWVCSVVGAIAHVVGQMGVAVVVMGTATIAVYLPVLIVSAIITGILTGSTAQLLVDRLPMRIQQENNSTISNGKKEK